jgi:hypothetical protein
MLGGFVETWSLLRNALNVKLSSRVQQVRFVLAQDWQHDLLAQPFAHRWFSWLGSGSGGRKVAVFNGQRVHQLSFQILVAHKSQLRLHGMAREDACSGWSMW